jgi:ligand-binding sensor domain-containing protein/two-component sensor histidine kinase
MLRHTFILLLIALIKSQLIYSQSTTGNLHENIKFHRITTQQGLPNDNINCVLQDKKGFLWIGTTFGLCRYDGSRMVVYKNDPADPFSISDNNIINLSLDAKNRIWAGTYWEGLNMLNETTHQFSYFKNQSKAKALFANNSIPSVYHLDSTHIAIAQGELLILDIKNKVSEFIELPENTWSEKITSKTSDVFRPDKILIDQEKKWWLTGEAGLVQYDPLLKKMNLFSLRKDVPPVFRNSSTWNCKEDSKGNIWVASDAGLFEYKKNSDQFIQHYPTRFLAVDGKSKWVTSILCHSDGSIWFGTTNGLFHYSPASGKYIVYRNNPQHSLSISDNTISCLYEDKQHIVWIGTQNGLNAVYPDVSAFNVYQNIPGDDQSLQSNLTHESFKDEQGNIWVGTNKGLECIDAKTNKVSQYHFFDPHLNVPAEYNVYALLQHDASSCWIGTWGSGMQLFDIKKRKFIASYAHSSENSFSISSNHIKSFCKDDEGNLWIATWNGGIEKFDIQKKTFTHFNTADKNSGVVSDYVSKIYFHDHTVWAGIIRGLLKYDAAGNRFINYSITNDSTNSLEAGVSDIDADDKGNLWVGTFMGLTKFTIRNNHFEKITSLGNDRVADIYPGKDQSLWLATAAGLKQYDPNTGLSLVYALKDGLPISYFPTDCYFYRSADGEIFVNSNNGLIHFYPEHITRNQAKPLLHFTSIKIENKELNGIGNLNELKDLQLNYDQNYLAISFAALNLINPSQNQYIYKLDGGDKEWIYAGSRNEAIYTNLPPGDYVLRVKGSNDAGIWNEEGIKLAIHINTPWWRTWWFYGICALAFVGVGYSIYRIRVNRLIAELKLRNKIARDLHDDIGSTLSGIKLFSGMALTKLEKERSEAAPILQRIGERSEKMIDAMSDIVWSIHPKNDELEDVLVRMKNYTAEMLEPKNIAFDFKINAKELKSKLPPDVRKELYLIFKEIINNVVKHADCTQVDIELKYSGKNFLLRVTDNGKGFDNNKENGNGNGLLNLRERAGRIRAEITIISDLNKGTEIELRSHV